jgi:hypothetical protein
MKVSVEITVAEHNVSNMNSDGEGMMWPTNAEEERGHVAHRFSTDLINLQTQ